MSSRQTYSTIVPVDFTFQPFHHSTATEVLAWASQEFGDGLVMSTSFGIQSAVTLHLAIQARPSIPVIWVNTGYLPPETYEYAQTLTKLFDLNLHIAKSPISPQQMEARFGRLWESERVEDLNRYDQMRKVEPMNTALKELNATAWISGLRAEQTEFRRGLRRIQKTGQRYRIYPILKWTKRKVYEYMQQFGLPQHPLFHQGYATVGDAHSSRAVSADDADDRVTRFGGRKQECGLHLGQ